MWQPIDTAPKDREILVWYDHDADPHQDPKNPKKLTDYAAHTEGGDFMYGKGCCIVTYAPAEWENTDEYGSGFWLTPVWLAYVGSHEVACNATHWMPLPEPPITGE